MVRLAKASALINSDLDLPVFGVLRELQGGGDRRG